MRINAHYSQLKESYLFSDISHKVAAFKAAHPDADVIRMGIGDVTLPLCQAAVDAMGEAVKEMGRAETFRGYGPEQGYDFLRDAIASYYATKGVDLDREEIFVSDGAKSDLGNILDLFDSKNTVLIPDPVYPVYVDTNLMAGRQIQFLKATVENQFLPMPPAGVKADIVYLCSPNNPTGAVYNRDQLTEWVAYANEQDAILLFDSAYEAFIQDASLPRSIYEIPGAKTCAIEFCSFSKTAGFTGTRCGYTVVPKDLTRGNVPQSNVASPSDHEIQRCSLYCPARGGGCPDGGRDPAGTTKYCILYGECGGYRQCPSQLGDLVYRRGEFTLYLDAVSRGI